MESIWKKVNLAKQMSELKNYIIEDFAQTQDDDIYMNNFHD